MSFVYALTHYFYPTRSNNQKAKLVHTSTLVLFTLLLVVYQLALSYFPHTGVRILGYAANIPASEVVVLTNQKRLEAGLNELTVNPLLEQAARSKAQHMLDGNYWAHVAPDGTEPWKFFLDAGYKYRYAGENLARDFTNPGSVVDAWLASPSHRDNMLSSKYTEIGIAVVEGDLDGVDTTLVVQLFGSRIVDTTSSIPIAQAQTDFDQQAVPTTVPVVTPTTPVSPTPTVAPIPTLMETIAAAGESGRRSDTGNILISPFSTTKGISASLIVILLGVLVVDIYVVSKKRIPRIGGKTFAHIAFFGMILVIILIAKSGQIL